MSEDEFLKSGILQVAQLMAISAKTAPKARGKDNIVIKLLSKKEELDSLAQEMEKLAPKYGDFFARDANNVRNSTAVLIIGCKLIDMDIKSPESWKVDGNVFCSIVNLGIAIGSAVKTASILNVDNRIMYSIGVAAVESGIISSDFALGIPLSATSKNIYFDRQVRVSQVAETKTIH